HHACGGAGDDSCFLQHFNGSFEEGVGDFHMRSDEPIPVIPRGNPISCRDVLRHCHADVRIGRSSDQICSRTNEKKRRVDPNASFADLLPADDQSSNSTDGWSTIGALTQLTSCGDSSGSTMPRTAMLLPHA